MSEYDTYEELKAEIEDKPLSDKEYEQMIKAIAERLGI